MVVWDYNLHGEGIPFCWQKLIRGSIQKKKPYGLEFLGTNTTIVGEQTRSTATNFLVPKYGEI